MAAPLEPLDGLLPWRAATGRALCELRRRPAAPVVCWTLAALAIVLHEHTLLLGGGGRQSGALGVLAFTVAVALGAAFLLRWPAASPERTVPRVALAGLLVVVARVGLAAHPVTAARVVYPSSAHALAIALLATTASLALLPREVAGAFRSWRGPAKLLGPSFGAVALGVAAVETASWAILVEGDPRSSCPPAVLAMNVAAHAAVAAVLFAVTRRPVMAAALTALLHAGLLAACAVKASLLRTSLSIYDVHVVGDALRVGLVGPAVLAGAALAVVVLVVLLLRTPALPLGPGPRAVMGAAGALVLAAPPLAFRVEAGEALLRSLEVYPRTALPLFSVAQNGLLLELLVEAHALVLPTPDGYGAEAVERALDAVSEAGAPAQEPPAADLIVWLVEAFMDPLELGFDVEPDPIPTFRALGERGGRLRVASPVFGGMSANAEFELLTGMNLAFLPRNSCPYRQYLNGPLPALPALLRDRGWRTAAVHAESLGYYGYLSVYPRLGFDHVVSLWGRPGVELDAQGRRPSDAALARYVVELADEQPTPLFAFVFANSTHMPWRRAPEAPRFTIRTPMAEAERDQLEGYLQALHAADAALADLIDRLERRERPSRLVVLGDHLPGLRQATYAAAGNRFEWHAQREVLSVGQPDLETLRRMFDVPGRVWSSDGRRAPDARVGMSFVGLVALEALGVEPEGWFACVDALRRRVPVIGRYLEGHDGAPRPLDARTPEEAEALAAYDLLQYDLLLGEGYARDRLKGRRAR